MADTDTSKSPPSVRDALNAAREELGREPADTGATTPPPKETAPAPKEPAAAPKETAPAPSEKPADTQQIVDDKLKKDVNLDKSKTEPEKQGEAPTSEAPQAAAETTAAPDSWSHESKAVWGDIPERARQEIMKRENDMQTGVALLQKRYGDYEAAITPHKALIKQTGLQPAQLVKNLFDWQAFLSGEHKTEAFKQLAKSLNVDLKQLAPVQPAPFVAQDKLQGLPAEFQTFFGELTNKLDQRFTQLEQTRQPAQAAAPQQTVADPGANPANQHIETWSAGKEYFPQVRKEMGRLIAEDNAAVEAGQFPVYGTLKADGTVDLDTAYEIACRALPNVWSNVQFKQKQQAEAKAKEAAAKRQAEVDAAKKAASSLKPGTPTRGAQAPKDVPKNESVRETLERTMAERRNSRAN